jgi:hydrogenase nickel incorporation protein HypB
MCATCGCSEGAVIQVFSPGQPDHDHAGHAGHAGHDHGGHDHDDHDHGGHEHAPSVRRDGERTVELQQKVLAKNDRLAQLNRDWLQQRGVLAVNLMSSPGAGKTTLLERTAAELAGQVTMSVIEGDQAAALDATRISAAGCQVVQINTGTGCHLDAAMLASGLQQLDPPMNSVVFIENVGNLVCPALFDLGECARVVIASVTEGDDKPIKYPHIFRGSQLMLLNKIDLLPYVPFDAGRCLDYVRQVNPAIRVLEVSAFRGDGLAVWYGWLREQVAQRSHLV